MAKKKTEKLTKAGNPRKRPARKNEGRPPFYTNSDEMQVLIDKYFKECKDHKTTVFDKSGKPYEVNIPIIPTIAGCAYAVGMDRQTFYNYAKKDEFVDTIKKARDFIISQWESKLINTNANAGGIIFAGKNYGYSDKQEIEHSGGVKIIKDDIV